jgi:hypothetical protein
MASKKAVSCIGVAAGIALTLVGLNEWGKHLNRTISDLAQIRVLRPMAQFQNVESATVPANSDGLPAPWLPEISGDSHDLWSFQSLEGTRTTLQ